MYDEYLHSHNYNYIISSRYTHDELAETSIIAMNIY